MAFHGASQKRARLIEKLKRRRATAGPLTRREATQCVLERAKLMAHTPSLGLMVALREETGDCAKAVAAVRVRLFFFFLSLPRGHDAEEID